MKRLLALFRVNVAYGIIVIIPIAVMVILFDEILEFLAELAEPLAAVVHSHVFEDDTLAMVIAVVLLLFICFVIGAFVRTRLGTWSFGKVEKRILRHVPGYEIVRNMMRGFAEKKTAYRPALVSLAAPGTAVLGFVMEDGDAPYLTVFVPTAPAMTVGTVHVVERARVRMLEGSSMKAFNCIGQWGVGLHEVMGDATPPRGEP